MFLHNLQISKVINLLTVRLTVMSKMGAMHQTVKQGWTGNAIGTKHQVMGDFGDVKSFTLGKLFNECRSWMVRKGSKNSYTSFKRHKAHKKIQKNEVDNRNKKWTHRKTKATRIVCLTWQKCYQTVNQDGQILSPICEFSWTWAKYDLLKVKDERVGISIVAANEHGLEYSRVLERFFCRSVFFLWQQKPTINPENKTTIEQNSG